MTDYDQQLVKTLEDMNQMISKTCKKFQVYGNFYDLVLKEGQFFSLRQKPKGVKFGKVKECFRNASNLALDRDDLFYVEGYASIEMTGGLPFEHAWCVDYQGYVIDNTWRTIGTSYYGVIFDTDYLRKVLVTTEQYGILEYPNVKMLEEGFPEGAIRRLACCKM